MVTEKTHALGNRNPIEAMLRWADRTPTAVAVASERQTTTYAELAETVRRLAAALREAGIPPGAVVAVRARPELETVIMLALLHEGAVSLAATDAVIASYGEQLDWIVGERLPNAPSALRAVEVDDEFLASLDGSRAIAPIIEPRPMTGSSPCRVVFSSGTTGAPKGIEFTVDTLLARIAAANRNWMPLSPFMCLLGLETVSGFQSFMWAVFNGETYSVVADAAANLAAISALGVRSIKTSPARLADLLHAAESPGAPSVSLGMIQVAGGLLPPAVGQQCERVFGRLPVYLYGSTEVGTVTKGNFDPARPQVVGVVVPEAELQVVDGDGNDVSAQGSVGVVRCRSDRLPTGYWRIPQASAFRDGWFYPGDIGVLTENGELSISGRVDDLVNAGGTQLNLAELDLRLSQIELFTDAASFQFLDTTGRTSVGVAFACDVPADLPEIRRRVSTTVPELIVEQMIQVEVIPRNGLGKVNRRDIVAQFMADRENPISPD